MSDDLTGKKFTLPDVYFVVHRLPKMDWWLVRSESHYDTMEMPGSTIRDAIAAQSPQAGELGGSPEKFWPQTTSRLIAEVRRLRAQPRESFTVKENPDKAIVSKLRDALAMLNEMGGGK